MERILLVGSTDTLNENISFVLQLAGFEVSLVRSMEEAINLNDIYRYFIRNFDMLVLSGTELSRITQKGFDFLRKIPQQVKILIAERDPCLPSESDSFDNLYRTENIYFCNTTNITVETKKIFGRI
ncbi:hypothetical protein A7E78_07935 [Syntrophotalea acetylenivorans]|uniref:Response regulatory domain-containing protein n=1 Tax=Syntrophotalea acetylenivorans TaxID=1842532 RepID=A0A1L3GPA3_9BACT|nr:hypothetical protein [Syntrophotalea acetylenivorans]APG27771.1 hypothetical protein A7E78_07935 [Syntrophotalea acetylenivorans]